MAICWVAAMSQPLQLPDECELGQWLGVVQGARDDTETATQGGIVVGSTERAVREPSNSEVA